jgi:Arc/MetJ family transcription regulator
MKTTIDIPDAELAELLKHTRAKTKKSAVVRAVVDFNRRQRLSKLAEVLGTFNQFMTQRDLQRMREGH